MKFRWIAIVVIMMLSVSVALAQTETPAATAIPPVCGQATGSAAPALSYVVSGDHEKTTADFTPELLKYLNTTGTSAGLQTAIETASNSPVNVPEQPFQMEAQVIDTDVTGDLRADVLIFITVLDFRDNVVSYATYLFGCTDHEGYRELESLAVPGYGLELALLYVIDLNHNGLPEIAVRLTMREDTFIQDALNLLEWNGTALVPDFLYARAWLPFSGFSWLSYDDDPTTLEPVIADTYGYGQAVAASFDEITRYRPIERVFAWNGSTYDPVCHYFTDEPMTMIETLHSAELWRACGDYEKALTYYERLRTDDSLAAWSEPRIFIDPEVEDRAGYAALVEREYLRAFAGYRLVQLGLVTGDNGTASEAMRWLQAEYLPGRPGAIYMVMAASIWNSDGAGATMSEGCLAAEQTARDMRGIGFDPGIVYQTDRHELPHHFYETGDFVISSNPDNLFEVPPDVGDVLSIPVCLQE